MSKDPNEKKQSMSGRNWKRPITFKSSPTNETRKPVKETFPLPDDDQDPILLTSNEELFRENLQQHDKLQNEVKSEYLLNADASEDLFIPEGYVSDELDKNIDSSLSQKTFPTKKSAPAYAEEPVELTSAYELLPEDMLNPDLLDDKAAPSSPTPKQNFDQVLEAQNCEDADPSETPLPEENTFRAKKTKPSKSSFFQKRTSTKKNSEPVQQKTGEDVMPMEFSEETTFSEKSPRPPKRVPKSTPKGLTAGKLFRRAIMLFLVVTGGWQLWDFIQNSFFDSMARGIIFSSLIAAILLPLLWLFLRECLALRSLRQTDDLRKEAVTIIKDGGADEVEVYLDKLRNHYKPHKIASEIQYCAANIDYRYEKGDRLLRRVSDGVLARRDKAVQKVITKYSLEAGVLVGMSPLVGLDMIFMGWRNLRMLKEIYALYGVRPGYAVRMRILKGVFTNMALAGATELVTEMSADAIGWSVLSHVSAQLGQAVGASFLTARMGLSAMELVRPLPFYEDEKPKLSDMRGKILSGLRQLGKETEKK
ncbi:MAG: TIGR01620 family protein [Desulfovibrio sp.]